MLVSTGGARDVNGVGGLGVDTMSVLKSLLNSCALSVPDKCRQ